MPYPALPWLRLCMWPCFGKCDAYILHEMLKTFLYIIIVGYRPYRALTSRSNKDTVYETLFVFFRVLSAFCNEKISSAGRQNQGIGGQKQPLWTSRFECNEDFSQETFWALFFTVTGFFATQASSGSHEGLLLHVSPCSLLTSCRPNHECGWIS